MEDAQRIIGEAAARILSGSQLSRILLAPTSDLEGRDAWQVTIVLKTTDVTGDQALRTISAMRQALVAAGDEAFPFADFATEAELQAEAEMADGFES